ncbi:MAG TPA: hypothetical protein VGA62_08380 [Acidimicrobiia bacterium]
MWLRRAIGIVLVSIGLVWFLQGVGLLAGSFMTGEAVWAVIGFGCMAAGVVIVGRPANRT